MQSADPNSFQSLRERNILSAAVELLQQKGSLAMRVLDIAREADISVGTFYAHFESKEDLILAMMTEATRMRRRRLRTIYGLRELDSARQWIVGLFGNVLFAADHPGHFAAEDLAKTRSVWEGGSEGRIATLKVELEELASCFRSKAAEALTNGHLESWDNPVAQADRLDETARYLMVGSTHVQQTQGLLEGSLPMERSIPSALQTATEALLKGFGWKEADPHETVQACVEMAMGLDPEQLMG
ncbi:MAG: TetR family transcriptional regulator [Planctomycetes bacterium]|nr:TetR family transcriptional regulator [Planctomycetota bacterium]HPF14951.1 TetR family transcriptional regulator [Planctomycetota bacterium]HRV80293.1 TetR family transcriptional regulator [Planctomycetota bacterium]